MATPRNQGYWLSGRKARMLLCAAGTSFLIMLDANIVAVALPSIARDLHGEFTDVEWVISAYILPFAALLMATGALADRLGRRRILLWGLSIFTISSLLCGLAPTLIALNAARALQAVGAALQLSAALAIISHGFEPHERARAYAIWGTVMGVAPTMGPLIGGLISTYFGWRWAFLVNIPVGILLIAVATTSIDESRDPEATRLDLAGIALFGSGLCSIVWALIGANGAGWGSALTVRKLVLGAVLLGLFVIVENMQHRPMVDLSMFRDRTVVGAAVAMFGYAATAQVMMTILPLYLQDAFGQSPAVAGLSMIPFALPLLVWPTIGGKMASRISGRTLLASGLAVVALGNALTAGAIEAGLGYWAAAIGMFVTGSGAGLLNSETTKVQISVVPSGRAGMASGIAATTRFVGIVVGLAVLGAVLAATAETNLRQLGTPLVSNQHLDWHALSLRVVGGDVAGGLALMPTEVRTAIASVIHHSVAAGFGASLAIGALGAIISSISSWLLIRAADTRPSSQQGVLPSTAEFSPTPGAVRVPK